MKQDEINTYESTPEFSALDIHFVRASLSSKTDEEIASILDKPVNVVRVMINDMTSEAGQRQQEILQQRLARAQAESIKRNVQRKKVDAIANRVEKKEKEEKRERKERSIRNREEANTVERRRREVRRQYKTLNVDYSKLQTLKIDNKTTVYLKPGDDPIEVSLRYHEIRKKQTNGTHFIED